MASGYEGHRGHRPDFRVRYRFLPESEGGRRTLPAQGYRSDWLYEGDDPMQDGIFMIHPEFESSEGGILPKHQFLVSPDGFALMWILNPKMRGEVHQGRVSVGTKGFFVEGARKVAEAEVVEVIGLHTNPTHD